MLSMKYDFGHKKNKSIPKRAIDHFLLIFSALEYIHRVLGGRSFTHYILLMHVGKKFQPDHST